MTICRQWAWKPNDKMKSLQECLQNLVACAAGDGNLLFNVGPMPDGRMEERQVARLREMGAWLAKNGESIYGTRGGPWKPGKGLASTRKGSTVYVHILRPDMRTVDLPALPRPVKSAALLGGGVVQVAQRDGKLSLGLGQGRLDPIDAIVKLELEGSALDIPALPIGAPAIKAAASNVFQQQSAQYGPQEAFDGDLATRWATDGGTRTAWIEADFGKPCRIQGVRVNEALEERVRQFELQYREGDTWKTIFAGQKLGPAFLQKFEPVTAQHFRLNILDATDGPTISEIEFLEK